MPITIYNGLPRSGKSYEVVRGPVLDALKRGRRVVTNIDGLNEAACREYLVRQGVDEANIGRVYHVTNMQTGGDDFLPHYDKERNVVVNTIVKPGDLVVIDEAFHIWGKGLKIKWQHQSFFAEHGHFTDPDTGVSCDLICMIQDITALHPTVRNLCAQSFKCHRKTALGLAKVYSVSGYEGWKQQKQNHIATSTYKYSEAIFPLYSSFHGGVDGRVIQTDKRSNIFRSKQFLLMVLGGPLLLSFSSYKLWQFFHPAKTVDEKKNADAQAVTASPPQSVMPIPALPVTEPFSTDYRYGGRVVNSGIDYIVLIDNFGRIRLESPSNFRLAGLATIGVVDGKRVTVFSGQLQQVKNDAVR